MKIKRIFLGLGIFVLGLFLLDIILPTKANEELVDVSLNEECDLEITSNGIHNEIHELQVNVNDIAPGRRLDDFVYCLKEDDCNDENNWKSIHEFDETNREITAYENSVGSNAMSFWFNVPGEAIYLKAQFEDFEPMDITYANYTGTSYNTNDTYDLSKYGEYHDLVTGYKGGDIVLTNDCVENGCILKFTMTKENYNAYIARLDYYNENLNGDMDPKEFVSSSQMFNHLDEERHVGADTLVPLYVEYLGGREQSELIIDEDETTVSFYLVVNKYFTDKNRADFVVGENANRILGEDYIGLNYKVNRKYFDEGNNYGFLTFNEYNDYSQVATIFYGTPEVQFSVDKVRELSLTNTGESHMGTIKNAYDKIVSKNQDEYPIDDNFKLTITSFYNPDYIVPIELKNGNTKVADITLRLSRFAFGEVLIVDSEGNNCQDPRVNQNCSVNNAYVSAQYRGLYDTFYSNGEPEVIDAFFISEQRVGNETTTEGRSEHEVVVYKRNLEFNPWALAIYYSGDKVVGTKTFDLGEVTKIEGYSDEAIPEDEVNNKAYNQGNLITDYDSADYEVFGYGLGHEIPINKVKYFPEGSYHGGNLNYTLILASKQVIDDNNITKIALFLTNGELLSNYENFPELTYGVGEGKIYEIDHRTFDIFGGNE